MLRPSTRHHASKLTRLKSSIEAEDKLHRVILRLKNLLLKLTESVSTATCLRPSACSFSITIVSKQLLGADDARHRRPT